MFAYTLFFVLSDCCLHPACVASKHQFVSLSSVSRCFKMLENTEEARVFFLRDAPKHLKKWRIH